MGLMSGGNRFRYGVVLGIALILAACNRPDLVDAAANPTSRLLSLEEIETAVVATLEVEGEMTAAARPSDTPTAGEPSATPASSPAPALTSTHTPTSSPTAKPSLAPPTHTLPPPPSATLKPTDKPTSAPPTNTPCPKFTNATLSARVINSDNEVNLAWGSSGGCGPFSGAITAEYEKDSDPFAKYAVSGQSGKLVKRPDVRCEGTFTIVYILTLFDGSGQTIGAETMLEVFWLC